MSENPTTTSIPSFSSIEHNTQLARSLSAAQTQINQLEEQVMGHQATADYQEGWRGGNAAAMQALVTVLGMTPSSSQRFVTVGMRALMEQNASLAQQLHDLQVNAFKPMQCGHPQWAMTATPNPKAPHGVEFRCAVCEAISSAADAQRAQAISEVHEFITSREMWKVFADVYGPAVDDFASARLLTQLARAMANKLMPAVPAEVTEGASSEPS